MTAMHYHVTHNIPGYLPESEDGAYPLESLAAALSTLADDLARYADDLYERCALFAMPDERWDEDEDEAAALESEGDRVHAMATAIGTVAERLERDESVSTLTLEGEPYPLEMIATGGLSVGVSDPARIYDLGINYHCLPCDEHECMDSLED